MTRSYSLFVYNCQFDCQGQGKLFLLLTSFTVMTPHPVRDVDMERKEELILAKQLRAARVTILSRVGNLSISIKYFYLFTPISPQRSNPRLQ